MSERAHLDTGKSHRLSRQDGGKMEMKSGSNENSTEDHVQTLESGKDEGRTTQQVELRDNPGSQKSPLIDNSSHTPELLPGEDQYDKNKKNKAESVKLNGKIFRKYTEAQYGQLTDSKVLGNRPNQDAKLVLESKYKYVSTKGAFVRVLALSDDEQWYQVRILNEDLTLDTKSPVGFVNKAFIMDANAIVKSALASPGVKIVGKADPLKKAEMDELAVTEAIRLHKAVLSGKEVIGPEWVDIFRVLSFPSSVLFRTETMYQKLYKSSIVKDIYDHWNAYRLGDWWDLASALLKRAGFQVADYVKVKDSNADFAPGEDHSITSSNPQIIMGESAKYTLNKNYDSYQWSILYSPGGSFAKTDKSASVQQLDGKGSQITINWKDWKFPGKQLVICKGMKDGKITYHEFLQEVIGPEVFIKDDMDQLRYEIIAHNIVYNDFPTADQVTLLDKWGYDVSPFRSSGDFQVNYCINNRQTGLFAMLIIPKKEMMDVRNPILAFRGTEPTGKGDLMTDLDTHGPGYNQFMNDWKAIKKMIQKGVGLSTTSGKIDMTGHSLGGALCQWTAAYFDPGNFAKIVTFQSPGISTEMVTKYTGKSGDKPQITYHIASGDVVDLAGEEHLPGTYYLHNTGTDNPMAHMDLLFASETFKEERSQLGLDDATLTRMGIAGSTERNMIQKFDSYPFETKSLIVEDIRKIVAGQLWLLRQTKNLAVKGAKLMLLLKSLGF